MKRKVFNQLHFYDTGGYTYDQWKDDTYVATIDDTAFGEYLNAVVKRDIDVIIHAHPDKMIGA